MKNKLWILSIIVCLFLNQLTAQEVSTFAGSTYGYVNDTGTNAKFSSPEGICADNAGNFYVADMGNHCIRKITPAGVVTTLAGAPTSGYADGLGANARFYLPNAIRIDAANNLYVADSYNNRIRKIDPTGLVTTVAGSTSGNQDGVGVNAQFNHPSGLCVAADGTIYVSDTMNNRIRKINPSGEVTTLAGSVQGFQEGLASSALFYQPNGMCLDTAGNLYVCDLGNNRIRKISPSGEVSTFAGSVSGYLDANGTAAKFKHPREICVDPQGNFYVAEYTNNKIRKISPSGEVATYAGASIYEGFMDGPVSVARFYWPSGICMSQSGIFISEHGGSKVRKITLLLANSEFDGLEQNLAVWTDSKKAELCVNVERYNHPMQLVIVDLNGKRIYDGQLTAGKNTVDVATYTAGIYLITVIEGAHKITKKVKIE